jgi:hypothetical protein
MEWPILLTLGLITPLFYIWYLYMIWWIKKHYINIALILHLVYFLIISKIKIKLISKYKFSIYIFN